MYVHVFCNVADYEFEIPIWAKLQQWRSWGQADARACLGVANYIMGVFNYYFTNVQDHTVVVELVLSIAVIYSI